MIGEVVGGRYRVLAKIGEGGHGMVYRAEEVGAGREVALKIMHREREGGALQRFQREAELVQRLSHPNNVRLLDWGIHQGERPFSVFELLEGESLQQILKQKGPQPPARVVRITSQVLRALTEAHAVGIVHRDIKPANILVMANADEPDFVKVLDYGIAKSLREGTKALTRQGEVLGTPSYMPPELIEARPIGPSSDLYSLGLVMAEMLTGRRVYTGSPIDICLQQVSPNPVPLPPELAASPLGAVIARATEKPIERRYASAAEMLAALEQASAWADTVAWVPPDYRPSSPSFPDPSLPRVSLAALPAPRERVARLVLAIAAAVLAFGVVLALAARFWR